MLEAASCYIYIYAPAIVKLKFEIEETQICTFILLVECTLYVRTYIANIYMYVYPLLINLKLNDKPKINVLLGFPSWEIK